MTQARVAKRAGVSGATVSRAILGDPAVAPETRERVLKACRELDYKPSIAARGMAHGTKAIVGLSLGLTEHATSRYVALLYQALSVELAAKSWMVQLISMEEFRKGPDVGGLILLGIAIDDPRLSSVTCKKIPTVAIGHEAGNYWVAPDDVAGAEMAVAHLLACGRRRIGVISFREADGTLSRRVEGYCRALLEADIALNFIEAENTFTPTLQGYRTAMATLASGQDYDAFICATDELAIGALAACKDSGREIPREIAIIGFDDLPSLAVELTTIRQDIGAIARTSIALLDEAKRDKPPRGQLIPVNLIKRATT